MNDSFQALSNSNFNRSDASELISELRKLTYHSHMIFYFSKEYGVLFLRVLHQSMDFRWHFLKDEMEFYTPMVFAFQANKV